MRVRAIGSVVATCVWLFGASAIAAPAADAKDDAKRSEKAAALKQDMRKLWTDHVVWTRDYIVAAVADQPDAQAAAARLMKNQEDIGQAVAAYYGAGAGQQLTTLLKEHISIPLAAGERDRTIYEFLPYLQHRCLDILQPDCCHTGGITSMKKIAVLAETYLVPLAPHCTAGFLGIAASHGLTSAIMDARAPVCVEAVRAADFLLGHDEWGARWIAAHRAKLAAAQAAGAA